MDKQTKRHTNTIGSCSKMCGVREGVSLHVRLLLSACILQIERAKEGQIPKKNDRILPSVRTFSRGLQGSVSLAGTVLSVFDHQIRWQAQHFSAFRVAAVYRAPLRWQAQYFQSLTIKFVGRRSTSEALALVTFGS